MKTSKRHLIIIFIVLTANIFICRMYVWRIHMKSIKCIMFQFLENEIQRNIKSCFNMKSCKLIVISELGLMMMCLSFTFGCTYISQWWYIYACLSCDGDRVLVTWFFGAAIATVFLWKAFIKHKFYLTSYCWFLSYTYGTYDMST